MNPDNTVHNVENAIIRYLQTHAIDHTVTYVSAKAFHDTIRIDCITFAWDMRAVESFLDALQSESCDRDFSWIVSCLKSHETELYHIRIIVT